MARTVHVKDLSLESFAPYGTYANLLHPDTTRIGNEPIEFFRDMVLLDLGGASLASFSVCRVVQRPRVIDVTEYHSACGEVNLALDGDMLIHVAPATPRGVVPLDQFAVFRVPRGTVVALRPGVWHHAPFVVDTAEVNCLVALPERTYANDCEVAELDTDEVVSFEA